MSGTEGGLIRGLEGVVAAETQLCDLDGANGRLAYRGYDIDDLARRGELRGGRLPALARRAARSAPSSTASRRAGRPRAPIPPSWCEAFALMPKDTDPMRVLQAARRHPRHARPRRHRQLARGQPAEGGAARQPGRRPRSARNHRVRSGQDPSRRAPDLSHAANFLYMLTGRKPPASSRCGPSTRASSSTPSTS